MVFLMADYENTTEIADGFNKDLPLFQSYDWPYGRTATALSDLAAFYTCGADLMALLTLSVLVFG